MNRRISQSLIKIFEDQRIVLWYGGDEHAEMHTHFSKLDLAGIEKIELRNNEFAVKYRVLRQQPKDKFLLFIPGEQPANRENWLLDLCLANYIFSTDEAVLYLQELGLEIELKPVIQDHLSFFKNKERLAALQRIVEPGRDHGRELRYKLLAVIGKTEPQLERLLMSLIAEAADGKTVQIDQVEKFGLADFLWQETKREYGYTSESPSVDDLVKALFQSQSSSFLPREKPRLGREAIVFLQRWKDSAANQIHFEYFSNRLAREWSLSKQLETLGLKELAGADLYELIDQKILSDLKQGVLSDTISFQEAQALIRQREQKYWYSKYSYHYQAISAALTFLDRMRTVDFRFGSSGEALRNYVERYYLIDQAYRQYYYAYLQSGSSSLLAPFTERIEREYGNRFLLQLNDQWQEQLDKSNDFSLIDTSVLPQQRQFWKQYIQPYIEKGNRIFVIISDAMRFESGAELYERLLQEARFDATLDAMIASFPTFTQLGMASLLPHQTLTLMEQGTVLADGKNTKGTINRDKILSEQARGKAISAKEFLQATTPAKPNGRQWVMNFDVIYIYSKTIDKTGEDQDEKLFERTEEEFQHIINLLKKIAAVNGTNVIITADHGYLYQFDNIAESDFANFKVEGQTGLYNRRFVLGHELTAPKGGMHFTNESLRLEGKLEIMIPKSVNRLRQSGSGSRYVHGGMSLQELVIPVIQFSKKRTAEDDINLVSVELIRTTSRITSNQIVLSFYQKQAVKGKWHARELRLGFYNQRGELISNQHSVRFDSSEEAERKREQKVTFHFSQLAEQSHHQEVYLRMEDPSGGKYGEEVFTMMISFTSDFDI